MGREEGGGFRMGNTCIPVVDEWEESIVLVKKCQVSISKPYLITLLVLNISLMKKEKWVTNIGPIFLGTATLYLILSTSGTIFSV